MFRGCKGSWEYESRVFQSSAIHAERALLFSQAFDVDGQLRGLQPPIFACVSGWRGDFVLIFAYWGIPATIAERYRGDLGAASFGRSQAQHAEPDITAPFGRFGWCTP